MSSFNPIIQENDDGLFTPKIGPWGFDKYRMIGTYMNIFTSSMKTKWKNLVYIDLFSGAGLAKLKSTGKIVRSSALISLSIPNKFDHYIFCEENLNAFSALETRLQPFLSSNDISLFNIDSNEKINLVIERINTIKKSGSTLCFCFVDPFSINIHFKTILELTTRFRMDFLILFASDMDLRRNHSLYSDPEDSRVALQLGESNWRYEYENLYAHTPQNLIKFVSEKYIQKMDKLDYKHHLSQPISNFEKNRILYHLIFFSKHPLGKKFATISSSYSDNQLGLDL